MTERIRKQSIRVRYLAFGTAILPGTYLLLTSTLKLHESVWPYDIKRLLEFGLLALIFCAVLLSRVLRSGFGQQIRRVPGWVKIMLILLFCLGLVSSWYNSFSAMSLYNSLFEVALLGLLFLATFCIAACRKAGGHDFDRAAIVLIAMVAAGVGLQELLGVFAAWNSGMEFNPEMALLHYSYPRFYNQVQTWSIPAIAALPLVFPGKGMVKALCVAALILEYYVMLATGGRGSMAATSLAIFTGALFLPGIRKTLILYPLAGLLGGCLIYGLVLIGFQNLQAQGVAGPMEPERPVQREEPVRHPAAKRITGSAQANESGNFSEPLTGERIWTSSGRLYLWRHSLSDMAAHPLLGIGPMNYACTGPLDRSAHPHNFPLQVAGEWGIPALLILLVATAWAWTRLLHILRGPEAQPRRDIRLAGFLATAALAAMIHACLSGVVVMPASQVAGIFVCGWLLGLMPLAPSGKLSHWSPPVLLVSGLAVSVALLAFGRQELAVADIRLERTQVLDRGIPRLWQNGKVCRLYREAARRSDAAK